MASRTPPGRRRPSREPTFPVIPIAIGVIVLGLVIGAAIATLRRNGGNAVALATPSAIPTPQVAATVTEVPTSAPTPEPTAAPTERATAAPGTTPAAAPSPTMRRQTAPSRLGPKPVTIPHAAASAAALAHPAAAVHAVAPPPKATAPSGPAVAAIAARIRPPSPAVARETAAAAAPSPDEAANDAELLDGAKQTVRTYIGALISGDDATASAQLLANAGSSASQLSEKSVLDSSARIVDLNARATSATTATVDADISTGNGLYYAHFELRRLDSGVVLIQEHNYAKS